MKYILIDKVKMKCNYLKPKRQNLKCTIYVVYTIIDRITCNFSETINKYLIPAKILKLLLVIILSRYLYRWRTEHKHRVCRDNNEAVM